MPSAVSDSLGVVWPGDWPGSSDFPSLGAGLSTSIASGGVGWDEHEQVASGVEVGVGCSASRLVMGNMNQLSESIQMIQFTQLNRFSDSSRFNELLNYKYSDKTESRHDYRVGMANIFPRLG